MHVYGFPLVYNLREIAGFQRGHVATCGRVDAVAGPGSYRSFVDEAVCGSPCANLVGAALRQCKSAPQTRRLTEARRAPTFA